MRSVHLARPAPGISLRPEGRGLSALGLALGAYGTHNEPQVGQASASFSDGALGAVASSSPVPCGGLCRLTRENAVWQIAIAADIRVATP